MSIPWTISFLPFYFFVVYSIVRRKSMLSNLIFIVVIPKYAMIQSIPLELSYIYWKKQFESKFRVLAQVEIVMFGFDENFLISCRRGEIEIEIWV